MTEKPFAEWVAILDRFAAGDATALDGLEKATVHQSSDVLVPFGREVITAFDRRLKELGQRLQRDLDRPGGSVDALTAALRQSARTLAPLQQLADLPALPDHLRTHLRQAITIWCDGTRTNLERSAQRIADQGHLLRLIRGWNPLAVMPPLATVAATSPVSSSPTGSRTTRSILIH